MTQDTTQFRRGFTATRRIIPAVAARPMLISAEGRLAAGAACADDAVCNQGREDARNAEPFPSQELLQFEGADGALRFDKQSCRIVSPAVLEDDFDFPDIGDISSRVAGDDEEVRPHAGSDGAKLALGKKARAVRRRDFN